MKFQMADTQFYIMIGILTAIAAIVSAEVRDSRNLRPTNLKWPALILLVAVWVNILQILLITESRINYEFLTKMDAFHYGLHSIFLIALGLLATQWHASVARHRETDAGLPPSPAKKTPTSSKEKEP